MEEMTAKGLGVNLTSLTGKPLPTDELLYCVPVCAPYETLKDYKYKVKVIPGMEKKGKALKLCLDLFLHTEGATDFEKDLIKAVPEADWHLTLISNCKLSAAGIVNAKGKKGAKKK
uniref:NFACT protein C-terminal domain-containing protein n=1 Tax=Arcella intermedia TaxID=1963864 RepID=A0A6B2LSH8_9EUKA